MKIAVTNKIIVIKKIEIIVIKKIEIIKMKMMKNGDRKIIIKQEVILEMINLK